jgi:hypothetical protein
MQILFSGAIPDETDHRGVTAVIGVLDLERGRILHRFDYVPPPEIRAVGQKVQFTGYCFRSGSLWVCSHNEIVRFDEWPPTRIAGRVANPGFNDLHHCNTWRDAIAVANTGLETVDVVSTDGRLLERFDLLRGLDGARRIDPELAYGKLPDTKPHVRHVNHVFELDGELWATQLQAQNAVCLTAPRSPIEIKVGMPHDGRRIGDSIVFTTTNGHLAFASVEAPHPVRDYDLLDMTPGLRQLGWCRGVCRDLRDPDRFVVAFSTVRNSHWKEFTHWIKHGHEIPTSRVCLYDLKQRRLLKTIDMSERGRGLILFQVDPVPPERELR